MHPLVLSRLRQEVLDVVGSSEKPTFDHIRNMKYMKAVINGWQSLSWSNDSRAPKLMSHVDDYRNTPIVPTRAVQLETGQQEYGAD